MRLLLLQIRNQDDPMLPQEIACFHEAIGPGRAEITTCDLLYKQPTQEQLDACDAVMIGGSGHYSATSNGRWIEGAFDTMRRLYDTRKPTFASCWGFQALARALGGTVVHDLARAELGTHPIRLTPAGQRDPLFGTLPSVFPAAMGHEDCVTELPPGAVLLASSERVPQQAFCFPDRPIYATQFHPELSRQRFLERVAAYPKYVQTITGLSAEEFAAACRDTPETRQLISRFLQLALRPSEPSTPPLSTPPLSTPPRSGPQQRGETTEDQPRTR